MRQYHRSGHRRRPARVEGLEQRTLLSVIYSADMSTNPGWTLDTVSGVGWGWGVPAGVGGDPSSGHTGTKVIGTIIGSPGYYPDNVPSAFYATTTAIDCSQYTDVTLEFWRWLGAAPNDGAALAVSSDGTNWTNVFANGSSTINETSWSHQTYDISAVADLQNTVYIRWRLGPTNASVHYCGWNIDDVTVSGMLHLPPAVTSINRSGSSPTNASSLQFSVVFSAPVTGVDTGDFGVSRTLTAGGGVSSVTGSGSNYTVTLSNVVGQGTLGLNLVDNDTIQDSLGVPLGGTGLANGSFTGPSYTVDRVDPVVSAIQMIDLTRDAVTYRVYFSEAVVGVDSADFSAVYTGTVSASIGSVTGSDTTRDVVVNTAAGDGTIALRLVDNDTIGDTLGNPLGGSGAGNGTYTSGSITVDHTAPAVVYVTPSAGTLIVSGTTNIDLAFSELVQGVDATDLVLSGPAAAAATVGTPVDLGLNVWRFPISGLVSGALNISLAPDAGDIQDWIGNNLAPATWNYRVNLGTSIVSYYAPGPWDPATLYRMRADGTGLTRLTTEVLGSEPAFSYDGTKIAYAAGTRVWSINADGSDQTLICYGFRIWTHPAFSPDGTKIAADDDSGILWELNSDGTGAGSRVNTPGLLFAREASYAGDGRLAFSGYNGSNWDIYVLNAARTGLVRLTTDAGIDDAPSFSRDGRKIVFESNRDGNYEIYIIDSDGTHLRRLTSNAEGDANPSFSPDGTRIAFESYRDGTPQIYTMDITGSNVVRITGPVGIVTGRMPTWSVDALPPGAISIATMDRTTSNTTTARWEVTFNEPVTGVDPADFDLATTGTASATLTVSGSGTVYTVTATNVTGDGTLTLNLVDNDSIQDLGGNALGGAGVGNGSLSSAATYTFDHTPPVFQITRWTPATVTNAPYVEYLVSFSEDVSGFDFHDLTVVTTGTAEGTIGDFTWYDMSYIARVDVTGDGTVGLNLVDDDSIVDQVGYVLGGPGAGNGNITGPLYTVDHTVPTILSIVPGGTSNLSDYGFYVTFSESVTGVDTSDFATSFTGSATGTITSVLGSGNYYTVILSAPSGDGTVQLRLTDDDTIVDSAGNRLGGTGLGNGDFTGGMSTIDHTAPTVTAVYVRGLNWAPGYLSFLEGNLAGSSATYGFAIPVGSGAAQLQTLPWRTLNRISIRFSEDVSVAQVQFAIVGSVGSYSVSGFVYNATDHVATWSLAAAIGPDKLYVAVPGSGSGPVTDLAGNVLDGEWSNPSSYSDASSSDSFPSGNGVAGGDFAFRFDVLPGDSTGGSLGKVNVADVAQTKSRSSLPVSTSTYRSDFDGNNLVNVADVAYAKTKSSLYALPVNPPVLPVFGSMLVSDNLLGRPTGSLRQYRWVTALLR